MPPGHQAIGLKGIIKLKHNEEGEVVKHKAHLVVKGYIQKQGVDFVEVFEPVARLESVCLFLAIAGTSIPGGPPHGHEICVPQ